MCASIQKLERKFRGFAIGYARINGSSTKSAIRAGFLRNLTEYPAGGFQMPDKVAIALWKYDTTGEENRAVAVGVRLQRMKQALEVFQSSVAGKITGSCPFKGIFLAPEYFFCAADSRAKRKPLIESQFRVVERALMDLSKAYGRILLIPGTVFYAKSLERPSKGGDLKFGPTGVRDTPKTSEPDRRARMQGKAIDAILSDHLWTGNEEKQGRVIMKGMSQDGKTVPPLNAVFKTLEDATKKPQILRNRAYILLDGKRIAKYDKQVDFFEAESASPDDLAFIPGTSDQCPEIGGYKFGMEICFDHANSMLARRAPPNLHFHLLVSDTISNKIPSMAMSKGGYFLHASTLLKNTRLYFRDGSGKADEVSMGDLHDVGGGSLVTYSVDLPQRAVPTPIASAHLASAGSTP
jgi:predicted amidohydrolase